MSRHHRRLHAGRWTRVRRAVLDRDGFRCRRCGKAGRMEVDHLVPLDRGGDPWDLANLQALCRSCHFAKTAAERRRPDTPGEAAWRAFVRELL